MKSNWGPNPSTKEILYRAAGAKIQVHYGIIKSNKLLELSGVLSTTDDHE